MYDLSDAAEPEAAGSDNEIEDEEDPDNYFDTAKHVARSALAMKVVHKPTRTP